MLEYRDPEKTSKEPKQKQKATKLLVVRKTPTYSKAKWFRYAMWRVVIGKPPWPSGKQNMTPLLSKRNLHDIMTCSQGKAKQTWGTVCRLPSLTLDPIIVLLMLIEPILSQGGRWDTALFCMFKYPHVLKQTVNATGVAVAREHGFGRARLEHLHW